MSARVTHGSIDDLVTIMEEEMKEQEVFECAYCHKPFDLRNGYCGCPMTREALRNQRAERLGGEAPTISAEPKSILAEAEDIINGDRHAAYGSYHEESRRIAAMWSVILRHEVKPEQVPLCMIALKLVREANKHKRDSLVDICGYAALLDRFYEKPTDTNTTTQG